MPTRAPVPAYKRAHQNVAAAKGKATAHKCISCPNQAQFWAYQHNDPDVLTSPKGLPYSLKPECYEPMCAGCHRRYDLTHDSRVSNSARVEGARLGALNRSRFQNDPEYYAKMSRVSQTAVKKVQAMRRRCLDCGMKSTPFGLGRHLSASGHSGYVDVD